MHEYKMMGLWILEMENPNRAHTLYNAMPAPLKAGAELRARCDGAQFRTPSSDAAAWIKRRYAAAAHGA